MAGALYVLGILIQPESKATKLAKKESTRVPNRDREEVKVGKGHCLMKGEVLFQNMEKFRDLFYNVTLCNPTEQHTESS